MTIQDSYLTNPNAWRKKKKKEETEEHLAILIIEFTMPVYHLITLILSKKSLAQGKIVGYR